MSGARVKALEWDRGVVDWAKPMPGMKYVACSTTPAGSWGWWLEGAPETRAVYASESAAKAAAQADYEARILSALDLSAPPTPAEAMRCAEVRGLVEALEWYASMMESPKSADLMALDADSGGKARAALAAMQEPPE